MNLFWRMYETFEPLAKKALMPSLMVHLLAVGNVMVNLASDLSMKMGITQLLLLIQMVTLSKLFILKK